MMLKYEQLEQRLNEEIDKVQTIDDLKPVLKLLAALIMRRFRPLLKAR